MGRSVTLSNEGYEWDKAGVAFWSAYFHFGPLDLWMYFWFVLSDCVHSQSPCHRLSFHFISCKCLLFPRLLLVHADVDQVIFGSDFLEFEHDPVFHSLHAERGGVEERVNICLAKIAFVKRKPGQTAANAGIFGMSSSFKKAAKLEDYVWHDGSLVLLAPLSSLLPRFFGASTVS